MSDFTHKTTCTIGPIKHGTPIRVEQYDGTESFGELLGRLGDKPYISYAYEYGDVIVRDGRSPSWGNIVVIPGAYVITDGESFATSLTDSGWEEIRDTETLVRLRFRMTNGDEYISKPYTEDYLHKSGLLKAFTDLSKSAFIDLPLTDTSKVIINPKHVSSVEVTQNV